MPCASTHLHLSDRILSEWRRHPDRSPLVGDRARAERAFLHGSLAPDMGFVPGTPRLVSELAHYVTPVTFARAVLAEARTAEEVAFGWGWASHVLGDVELHPLVGRAVGERIHGDRTLRMDAAEDVQTHVSLEVGMDIVLLEEVRVSPPPPEAFFGSGSVGLLGRSLERVYRVGWDRPLLLRTHQRAVTLTRWWPRTLKVLSRRGRLMGPLFGALRRIPGEGTPARGFLAPTRPQGWVMSELLERSAAFPDQFQRWVDGGLVGVPELNLETGGPAGAGLGHPASDDAERKLQRVRHREEVRGLGA